jgi:hypothetical protein
MKSSEKNRGNTNDSGENRKQYVKMVWTASTHGRYHTAYDKNDLVTGRKTRTRTTRSKVGKGNREGYEAGEVNT